MNRHLLLFFERVRSHGGRVAVHDGARGDVTYAELLGAAERVAARLLDGRGDLGGERVSFLVPPSWEWVAVEWGVWLAGGVAVPHALSHPPPELDYTLADSGAAAVVAAPELAGALRPLAEKRGLRFLTTGDVLAGGRSSALPEVEPSRRALVLYTSGTTGRPKGAVLTHGNLRAQVESLVEAWRWSAGDAILELLPLHHLHGIVNVVACALWSGARCEILPRFDAGEVWERIVAGRASLLMAVPTIYRRLIAAWNDAPADRRRVLSEAASRLRLTVSGSAALPVETLERWREITGHVLLERYGMTEIGMALANPFAGERVPGAVGGPLPGVEVRLAGESGETLGDGVAGEIEIRGPTVFKEYWGRPEATRAAFRDGWFRTGDVAVREAGVYRILGRRSVDIIKTGGEKVSALEIESVLAEHPAIVECAVVGVTDPEWGERVSVAAVLEEGEELDLETLRDWARKRLAVYKLPARLVATDELPRNAMGKVLKTRVRELFRQGPG
jgi:malonyl-CoA/methylmalonyl-CoA synthetase